MAVQSEFSSKNLEKQVKEPDGDPSILDPLMLKSVQASRTGGKRMKE